MSVFLRIVTAESLNSCPPCSALIQGQETRELPNGQRGTAIFPTTAAVANRDFVTLALLLAHGAKVMFKVKTSMRHVLLRKSLESFAIVLRITY